MRKSISLLIALALVGGASAQTSTTAKKSTTAQSTPKKAGTASKTGTTAKKAGTNAAPGLIAAEPTAIFDTTAGKLTCRLFPDKAPKTVANFVGLATGTKDWRDPVTGKNMAGTPLYSGTVFHRVIPGFMIQGGDPTGTGRGNPGYRFEDELRPDLSFDQPGRLAMANSGPGTNGSQFFITEVETSHLNACFDDAGCQRGQRHVDKGFGHTIFGQCDQASLDVVKQIANAPKVPSDPTQSMPVNPVKINSITIAGMPGVAGSAAKKSTTPSKTTPKTAPKTTPKKSTSGSTTKK